MSTDLPDVTIAAFPKGQGFWRIDWFGEMAFPDRMTRRQQPSVLVHLSRVIADNFETDPTVLLQANSTAPPTTQRKCWVSVGSMVLLRVGDIWRDQRPFLAPDYQLETFDLEVNDSSTTLIKSGLSRDEKFVLPLDHHPWHLQNTHAYCVSARLQDGREIVVPCMELIRFYFGSSSSLLTRLFLPPLTQDSLVAKSEFDLRRRHLRITLAKGIPAASAADIGRIMTGRRAWKAALQVGTSSLQASTSGEQHGVHPRMSFPFAGKTTITAAGKWLPLGERAEATFVVFNLRRCTHALGFHSLEYEVTSDARAKFLQGAKGQSTKHHHTRARDVPHQPLTERDPGRGLKTKHQSIAAGRRFPDLANKRIWSSRTIKGEDSASGSAKGESNLVAAAALGTHGSSQRIRPLEFTQAMHAEGRPLVPAFLAPVVAWLAAMPNIEVQLLTASDEDGWTIPIDLAADGDGVIDPSRFFLGPDGKTRLRRVAVFTLVQPPSAGVLAVIEADSFVGLYYHDWHPRSLDACANLLERIPRDFAAETKSNRGDCTAKSVLIMYGTEASGTSRCRSLSELLRKAAGSDFASDLRESQGTA